MSLEDDATARFAGPHRAGSQQAVPCWFMRGGTSRGPFFRGDDLPLDKESRDAVLLAAMGSPDPRQIDGLGGAHPLTSKAGIVSRSGRPDVDLKFLFAQLQPDKDTVETAANCGNMLAAVVPFAIEAGLIVPGGDMTTARVLTLNTGMVAEISVPTPADGTGRYVQYTGDTRIDGVPGTAAAVTISFLDTAGSVCDSLLPTGNLRDTIELEGIGPVEVTCIDNGMPLVIINAASLHRTGRESVAELNADNELKSMLEDLRRSCGRLMGLGDVSAKNYPKMTLVAPPARAGSISTRSFIPRVCHESIGVLAAVTVATAAVLDGTVAHDAASLPISSSPAVSVEHPSGEFTVQLELDPAEPTRVTKSALIRTARLIMAGNVMIPAHLWSPQPSNLQENQR
ncbi:4-oxalomesaconate tautomerase [Paenarthrobacter histidinolovorans]|uniref:4-oxalomesaconate tautomerase n=1 Tax=Paenarthrobacter histidinolovorans TaxID=43664 RepID=A0ABW8N791_9MICC